MPLITIEFDTDSLLIVACDNTSRQSDAQKSFSIPLGDEPSATIGHSLKQLLAKNGLTRSDAIAIVPRVAVEMREMSVPPAPAHELADIVRFSSKNEFANINESWRLDFVPIHSASDHTEKVLAVGLAPERYQQIIGVTDSAGVKLKQILLRPFAVYDLIKSEFADQQPRLIVNIHFDVADLMVTNGLQIVATRSVRLPSTSDADSRRRQLQLEIKRTFASSSSALGGESINEVVIVDSDSESSTLVETLKKQIEANVSVLKPSGVAQNNKTHENFAALGAFRQYHSDHPPQIDFLNPRRSVPEAKDRTRAYLYGGLAAAAVIFALGLAWWTLRSQADQNAHLRQQLNETIAINNGTADRPGVDQILGEVERIDQWKFEGVNWLDELYQISDRLLTPDDAIVDAFDAISTKQQPAIIVRSRLAGIQKESPLLDSMYDRPYEINPPTTGVSDEDDSYPIAFDFTILMKRDIDAFVRQIDQRAREKLQQQNVTVEDANPTNASQNATDSPPPTTTNGEGE